MSRNILEDRKGNCAGLSGKKAEPTCLNDFN